MPQREARPSPRTERQRRHPHAPPPLGARRSPLHVPTATPPLDEQPSRDAYGDVEAYLPFGNVQARNGLQARVEVPLLVRVLRPDGLFVHETPAAQHLAHPVRSFGRTLPWGDVPELVRDRAALLWAARRKRATAEELDG